MIAASGSLPRWAGDRLGYEMVEHDAATTGADARQLLNVASAEIIASFSRSARLWALER